MQRNAQKNAQKIRGLHQDIQALLKAQVKGQAPRKSIEEQDPNTKFKKELGAWLANNPSFAIPQQQDADPDNHLVYQLNHLCLQTPSDLRLYKTLNGLGESLFQSGKYTLAIYCFEAAYFIVKIMNLVKPMEETRHNVDKACLMHLAGNTSDHEDEHELEELLERNPSLLTIRGEENATPLTEAVASGNLFLVNLFLKTAATLPKPQELINAATVKGMTALHVAAVYGHTAILERLIEAKADVNQQDRNGFNALHNVILYGENGRIAVINILLNAGINKNQLDHRGKTASNYAIGNQSVLKTYIAHFKKSPEAKVAHVDLPASSSLFDDLLIEEEKESAKKKQNEKATSQTLAEKGEAHLAESRYAEAEQVFLKASIEASEAKCISVPEHHDILCKLGLSRIKQGKYEAAIEPLTKAKSLAQEMRANPKSKKIKTKPTPEAAIALNAAQRGDLETIRSIPREAIMDTRGKDDASVLMIAVQGQEESRLELVIYLINNAHANIFDDDENGKTVLGYAQEKGREDVVNYIKQKIAQPKKEKPEEKRAEIEQARHVARRKLLKDTTELLENLKENVKPTDARDVEKSLKSTIGALEALLKTTPKDHQARMLAAEYYDTVNDYENAIKHYELLYKFNEDRRKFHKKLCYFYKKIHDYTALNKLLQFLLKKEPNNIKALCDSIENSDDDSTTREMKLEKLVLQFPNDKKPVQALMFFYFHKKQFEKAEAQLDRLIELDPEAGIFESAHFYSKWYFSQKNKDSDQAKELFKKAKQRHKDYFIHHPDRKYKLLYSYERLMQSQKYDEDKPRAHSTFYKMNQAGQKNIKVLAFKQCWAQKRYGKALIIYDELTSENPTFISAYTALIFSYCALKDAKAGVKRCMATIEKSSISCARKILLCRNIIIYHKQRCDSKPELLELVTNEFQSLIKKLDTERPEAHLFKDAFQIESKAITTESPEESKRALDKYQQAANLGSAGAKTNLAMAREATDPDRAIRLYQDAANLGDSEAMFNLGMLHYEHQEYKQAVANFEYAIEENGNPFAKYQLGVCYKLGHGVTQDISTAKLYFMEARAGFTAPDYAAKEEVRTFVGKCRQALEELAAEKTIAPTESSLSYLAPAARVFPTAASSDDRISQLPSNSCTIQPKS